jgi:DHA1 family bicyclomycin/chloramphenicol resistance-like MFS transporter
MLGSFVSGRLSRRGHSMRPLITRGLMVMTGCSLTAAGLQLVPSHLVHAGFFSADKPVALLPFVFVSLFCFGLTSPAVTLNALEPVPHLSGSASGVIRSLQMILGSAASAFLAALCAHPQVNPAVATTLTMTVAVVASLTLYLGLVRGPAPQPAASHAAVS